MNRRTVLGSVLGIFLFPWKLFALDGKQNKNVIEDEKKDDREYFDEQIYDNLLLRKSRPVKLRYDYYDEDDNNGVMSGAMGYTKEEYAYFVYNVVGVDCSGTREPWTACEVTFEDKQEARRFLEEAPRESWQNIEDCRCRLLEGLNELPNR